MEKTLKLVLPAPEQKEEILNYKKEFEENREGLLLLRVLKPGMRRFWTTAQRKP